MISYCIHFILLKQIFIKAKSLKIGTFTLAKLLSNTLASCSLRNFDFLPLHMEHFDSSIILLFLVITTFGFLLSVFLLHFKQ